MYTEVEEEYENAVRRTSTRPLAGAVKEAVRFVASSAAQVDVVVVCVATLVGLYLTAASRAAAATVSAPFPPLPPVIVTPEPAVSDVTPG
jgi:hypothetical protein